MIARNFWFCASVGTLLAVTSAILLTLSFPPDDLWAFSRVTIEPCTDLAQGCFFRATDKIWRNKTALLMRKGDFWMFAACLFRSDVPGGGW